MAMLTNEQVKEIAEQLDCGFRCFWNRKTNDLISIPDMQKHPELDTEAWSEELDRLDRNFKDYQEIASPTASDSFAIMEAFAHSVNDSVTLKHKLVAALKKAKPFREFKVVIDNSGEYRQTWFDFKNRELQNWVRNHIRTLTHTERT